MDIFSISLFRHMKFVLYEIFLSLRSNPQEELNPGLHMIRITSNKKLRRHQVRKLIGEKAQRMMVKDKKSPKQKRVKEGVMFFADVRENETIVQLLRPMKAVDRIEYLRKQKLIDANGKLLENNDIVLSKLAKTAEITVSTIDDPCEAAKLFDRTEKRREDIRERIILIKGKDRNTFSLKGFYHLVTFSFSYPQKALKG